MLPDLFHYVQFNKHNSIPLPSLLISFGMYVTKDQVLVCNKHLPIGLFFTFRKVPSMPAAARLCLMEVQMEKCPLGSQLGFKAFHMGRGTEEVPGREHGQ